jgi:hypothetical protein
MKIAALALLLFACLASQAQACTETVVAPCEVNFLKGVKSISVRMHRVAERVEHVVSHPAGCPRISFCGCGAAVRIFGRPIRDLWLAANWFHFPRTRPAPGMAAVRRHHVMVLEANLGGGVWRVYDANSGRHRTRVHARSLAGFVVVDPRGRS